MWIKNAWKRIRYADRCYHYVVTAKRFNLASRANLRSSSLGWLFDGDVVGETVGGAGTVEGADGVAGRSGDAFLHRARPQRRINASSRWPNK